MPLSMSIETLNLWLNGQFLLQRTKFDHAALAVVSALVLSSHIWFKYLPLHDVIPDEYYHKIPQAGLSAARKEQDKKSRDITTVFESQGLDMVIFWGSQSGRAELLAKHLAKSLGNRFGLRMLAADMDDYDHVHISKLKIDQPVGFIVSTYGEGDPPDNAAGFWSTISKFQSEKVNLDQLKYFVFGLGNSKYRLYNRVADHVDGILESLNATRVGAVGRGDDAEGDTESDFLAWRAAIEEEFKSSMDLKEREIAYRPAFKISNLSGSHQLHEGEPFQPTDPTARQKDTKSPSKLRVSHIEKLWEDDERLCVRVDLDLGSKRLVKYKTGDHLALWATNPEEEVNKLLQATGLESQAQNPIEIKMADASGMDKMSLPTPATIQALFRHYLEISGVVPREVIKALVEFAPSDAANSYLASLEDIEAFKSKVREERLTFAGLLRQAEPVKKWAIPLSFLLENFKTMQPRYYSISSSALTHPQHASLTVRVDKSPNANLLRPEGCYGLNSNYLYYLGISMNAQGFTGGTDHAPTYSLCNTPSPDTFDIFGKVRQSLFKLPFKSSTPIIMLGAGTGVAPFRAFVQERVRCKEIGKEVGKTFLFMGFRHSKLDFVFEEDWAEWQSVLGPEIFKLRTAASREGPNERFYVQDRLRESGREVMELLNSHPATRIFICGSSDMAREVVNTLQSIKKDYSGAVEEEASNWIKQLRQSKNLIEEVWG